MNMMIWKSTENNYYEILVDGEGSGNPSLSKVNSKSYITNITIWKSIEDEDDILVDVW